MFEPENALTLSFRPTLQPNAWVAADDDPAPGLRLRWDRPQKIGRIVLSFDTDFDHAMESVQWGHPERVTPLCVRECRILDGENNILAQIADNHQTRRVIRLDPPAWTDALVIDRLQTHGPGPAALFGVQCYER